MKVCATALLAVLLVGCAQATPAPSDYFRAATVQAVSGAHDAARGRELAQALTATARPTATPEATPTVSPTATPAPPTATPTATPKPTVTLAPSVTLEPVRAEVQHEERDDGIVALAVLLVLAGLAVWAGWPVLKRWIRW